MRSRIILAAAVACCVSCIHAQEVEGAQSKEDEKAEEGKKPENKPRTARKEAPPKTDKEKQDQADTRPPAEEGRPELSTSADALMLPEGPRLIQEALSERGYLAKDHQTGQLDPQTSAALRKFQADEEVARTGYPDRETVRKLGLSIAKVFKATGTNAASPEQRR